MKKKYLLDTCICIHFLQNRPEVVNKILQIGWDKCCIAEATIGELLCGVRDDGRKARNINVIESGVNEDVYWIGSLKAFALEAKQKNVINDSTSEISCFATNITS